MSISCLNPETITGACIPATFMLFSAGERDRPLKFVITGKYYQLVYLRALYTAKNVNDSLYLLEKTIVQQNKNHGRHLICTVGYMQVSTNVEFCIMSCSNQSMGIHFHCKAHVTNRSGCNHKMRARYHECLYNCIIVISQSMSSAACKLYIGTPN